MTLKEFIDELEKIRAVEGDNLPIYSIGFFGVSPFDVSDLDVVETPLSAADGAGSKIIYPRGLVI